MAKLLEKVRAACRKAAAEAVSVRIEASAIPPYAESLPIEELALPKMDPAIHYLGHDRDTTAFLITLDAVNFGSGYFPDLLGDPRLSGYRTIAAALNDHFRAHGPISPRELGRLDAHDCARIFRQDLGNPLGRELMALFAKACNDLGRFLERHYRSDFSELVGAAGHSAERLVELLIEMPMFDDVTQLRGVEVPLYKRAQLAAADLFIAFGGEGEGCFRDIDLLTACADNLVPHVLRLDGILSYHEKLAQRIDDGDPLPSGSVEEAEIRACAVHAAELILEELRRKEARINTLMLDNFLWHRGQQPFYRARPRHRTRTVFY